MLAGLSPLGPVFPVVTVLARIAPAGPGACVLMAQKNVPGSSPSIADSTACISARTVACSVRRVWEHLHKIHDLRESSAGATHN